MTGYELAKAFDASLSFVWQAQTSQIYRELNALEKNGCLTSERVIQDEKPNKRVYSITDAGREQLRQWLMEPEAGADGAASVKSAFLMRLFFAGEVGDEQALNMLCAYREACLASSVALDEVAGSIAQYGEYVRSEERTKYWGIVAQFGESFCRAGIEWAEKAIALLEGDE